ncbi:MAG: GNAT family N-acetyltransferase [Phycisphaerales bacterium]|nr:MAG: GNAT family N-acetyltransferase [Phycisphaerales bacterium]
MKIEQVSSLSQIETVARLAFEIWNQHFVPIIGKAQVDYMVEKFQSKKAIKEQIERGYSYYLIQADGDYIGYSGICPKEDELFLSKLYLRVSQRGKGYGRQVVKFLENLARDRGLGKITLTVNKNNTDTIRAYERFGFTNQGPIVQDIGGGFVMDDYKMEKAVE